MFYDEFCVHNVTGAPPRARARVSHTNGIDVDGVNRLIYLGL